MKKGVSLKQLLVICIIIVVSAYGIYNVTTNWGLISKAQSLVIARKWLNEPNWKPNEITKEDTKCQCGEQVHTYSFSSSSDMNDMDIVQIDRKSGNVVFWASDFTGDDTSENPKVIAKAFKAWAPSHLPPAFLAKLSKMTPCYWVYRQDNGIWIPSTSLQIEVSKQGKVITATISDCHLSDYKGVVSVSPDQALNTVKQWIMLQYPQGAYEFYWISDRHSAEYDFQDPLNVTKPIILYQIGYVHKNSFLDHGDIVRVNASTGEVWDNLSRGWDSMSKLQHASHFLTVRYDKELVKGYPQSRIPLQTFRFLARKHKVSVIPGTNYYMLDGKRVALPSKVTAHTDVIYLPWQALKSLPGVKCQYDAAYNRLDVTTGQNIKYFYEDHN